MDLDFMNSKGYRIAKMILDLNGIHTTLTNAVTDDQASDYDILLNFIGTSWNLKINNRDEFVPEDSISANDIWLQELCL